MKKAFTLAEVLITLTIIGIIAALTIPNLIKNYQNHANYSALVKMQATLAHALKLASVENRDFIDSLDVYRVATPLNMIEVAGYLAPYLKYEKFCKNENGCWTATKKYSYDGGWINYNSTKVTGFKLKDGSTIRMSYESGTNPVHWCEGGLTIQIGVDVNGAKGPNEGGKDVFSFVINRNGQLYPAGTGKYYINGSSNVPACRKSKCSKTNGISTACAYKFLVEDKKIGKFYDE